MLISHKKETEFNINLHIDFIKEHTPEPELAAKKIELLTCLSEFALGRFLLTHRGLNGYWTSYLILHGIHQTSLSSLETWLLHQAPAIKATRERFYIFQEQLQKRLSDNMALASIPCGLMDDLLTLDYHGVSTISLTGIDLDSLSLTLAEENAHHHGIEFVRFLKKDAWRLDITEQFDVIVSNGLNIYEPDPARLVNLYRQYHEALKNDGTLITSFVTPPPAVSPQSPWKNFNIEDTRKQQLIFTEIIQANWQSYQLEDEASRQLTAAGFEVESIVYDSQCMFPTIVAKKT
ncbi:MULTISPECIES: bifunctional 2-polyprenyl-6-hydroxyphenol methylase/3-demethylubiquinol 3-O-methyltransferase UbiG [unclassified Legionella]|uniref:class I SAM-dependent methyltransferase n=1 Tax=unclassified Legionella TaxID=2622702 RepID=UPI0010560B8B|nr:MULTISPECIES: class I SAM-dependent methyltransferase [unclassified Legionella]MDI9817810.1 class I SAM-dependent methyltransferase [Legionella sp. PL877]